MCHKRCFSLSCIIKWLLIAHVDGPAEISQFYYVVDQDYVLGFEIPVDYVVAVEVDQGFDRLGNVVGGLDFGEEFLLTEAVEEGGLSELQYEVQISTFFVEFVEL